MLQAYVSSVSGVPDVCFKCFVQMLHIHACCKRMFQSVSGVSYACCKCFILMLYMFAMAFKRCSGGFANVSVVTDVCCNCFTWMLQKEILCCTYCNGTHLWQPPAIAVGVPPSEHRQSHVVRS
jgi:hypothetical protein